MAITKKYVYVCACHLADEHKLFVMLHFSLPKKKKKNPEGKIFKCCWHSVVAVDFATVAHMKRDLPLAR